MFKEKLKKITVFGAGLLVGTALVVIIPEGVRSLVSENISPASSAASNPSVVHSNNQGDPLSVIGYCLVLGFIFMLIVDQVRTRNKLVALNLTCRTS